MREISVKCAVASDGTRFYNDGCDGESYLIRCKQYEEMLHSKLWEQMKGHVTIFVRGTFMLHDPENKFVNVFADGPQGTNIVYICIKDIIGVRMANDYYNRCLMRADRNPIFYEKDIGVIQRLEKQSTNVWVKTKPLHERVEDYLVFQSRMQSLLNMEHLNERQLLLVEGLYL